MLVMSEDPGSLPGSSPPFLRRYAARWRGERFGDRDRAVVVRDALRADTDTELGECLPHERTVRRPRAVRDRRENAVTHVFVGGRFRRVVHAIDHITEEIRAARTEQLDHAPDDGRIDFTVVVYPCARHV